MDMDQAAVWLAGSILTMLGFIAVVIGIVVINNIFHKYWKPVRIFTEDSFTVLGTTQSQKRFMTPEEYSRFAPTASEENKNSDSKNIDLSKNR